MSNNAGAKPKGLRKLLNTTWDDFDRLPVEDKQFIWEFPVKLTVKGNQGRLSPEAKAQVWTGMREATARTYGADHPQAKAVRSISELEEIFG
jgi:hypothetical protein